MKQQTIGEGVSAAPAGPAGEGLGTILRQVERAARARPRGQAALAISYPPPALAVAADRRRLRQLLDDLVGRMLDGASLGSRVRVWSHATRNQVLILAQGNGQCQTHDLRRSVVELGARIGQQRRRPRGTVTWLLLPRAIAPPGEPGA